MDRNNDIAPPTRTTHDRYFEAIGVLLRRIQAFLQNMFGGSQLLNRVGRFFRPFQRVVMRAANNFEHEVEDFTEHLFRLLDIDWHQRPPRYLERMIADLEDLLAFLQDLLPMLRNLVDPDLRDPAFHDFLLGGDNRFVRASYEEIALLNIIRADQRHVGDTCAICLESYVQGEELMQMPCGHVYHTICITGWLRRNAICPIDREPIFVLLTSLSDNE